MLHTLKRREVSNEQFDDVIRWQFFYFMQIMLIELEMLPASREKRHSNITHSVDKDQPLYDVENTNT